MVRNFKNIRELKRQRVILILSLQIDFLDNKLSLEDYRRKLDRIEKAYINVINSWRKK